MKLNNSAFLAVQALLLTAGLAWAGYRVQVHTAERRLPELREEPLSVPPTYDYPVVVSDEQLERVMLKLRPRYLKEKTKINHMDHAMRFWTLNARFGGDREFVSGSQMRKLLTDYPTFVLVYGEKPKPLLMDEPNGGVGVRVQEGNQSSSHEDHTMACLAEVGTPLSFPVVTPERTTTFRAMLEQSLRDFSLNQVEYEWSALTYALFLPPATRWYTSEGQEMSFDRLAERIMREELPNGVCYANHRMHALVMFLRIDDEHAILDPATRSSIITYLQGITARLVQNQHEAGFWNGRWPTEKPESLEPTERVGDRIAERILATGHALEWWSLAPVELHPPRPTLAAGGQWLVKTIEEMSDEQVQETYTYLTHAGRALALWRSKSPAEIVKAIRIREAAEMSKEAGASGKESETPSDPAPQQ